MTSRRGRPKHRAPGARRSPQPEAATPFLPHRVLSTRIAGFLIFCFVLQCVSSMTRQSATYDEPVYIAAGYSYVETGDFRLKQDAPPLVATLSGLALRLGTYLGNEVSFDTSSRLWSGPTEYRFAEQFLARAADRLPHTADRPRAGGSHRGGARPLCLPVRATVVGRIRRPVAALPLLLRPQHDRARARRFERRGAGSLLLHHTLLLLSAAHRGSALESSSA